MRVKAEERLTAKELAAALKKSLCFVYDMRTLGFEMPGRTATVTEAVEFLRANGNIRRRAAEVRRGIKRDEMVISRA